MKKKTASRRSAPRSGARPAPALLASALASLGEGVLVLARPLRKAGLTIVHANAAFCRMSGYAAAELTGRGHGLLHVEPADRERLALWLRAGADHPLSGESYLKRQDGDTLSAAWTFSVIAESGKPGHLVAIYRDTTERRGLQKIEGHTQRLEAVGRLAGGVAHDFNNLTSVINGYCEMLAPQLEDHPRALHDVTEIHRAGRKAADLTRQLLAFGRRQPLDKRVIDLNQFVRENEGILTRLLGSTGKLVLELDGAVGHVRTDPTQFQQVLLNLMLNARDALRDRGTVTVRTEQRTVRSGQNRRATDPAPGTYAVPTVQDNGTGMDKETQEHLFEPFFTTKAKGKGSGLGLALVYGVVQQSGGFITVRSELLVGSTFEIVLPVEAAPAVPVPAAVPAGIPAIPATRGHEVVCVVEDDAVLRKMVACILTADGYRVIDAATAAEARQRANAFGKPMQLLVINLSGPDGEKLAKALHGKSPDLRVLNACNHNAWQTLDWLPVAHQAALPRPFALSELLKAARRLLDA
ncbi:MAG: ATP-binding protein [Cephaloticoccus sp.]